MSTRFRPLAHRAAAAVGAISAILLAGCQSAPLYTAGIAGGGSSVASRLAGTISLAGQSDSRPAQRSRDLVETLGGCCELAHQKSRVLAIVNRIRAQGAVCGRNVFGPAPRLSWSEQLSDASYGHAVDMAHRQYFDHRSPDGRGPADRVAQQGYAWRSVAENIAAGQETEVEALDGWLRSPGHCRNLLNPDLTEMGLAGLRVSGGPYQAYWVMTLGTPTRPRAEAANPLGRMQATR